MLIRNAEEAKQDTAARGAINLQSLPTGCVETLAPRLDTARFLGLTIVAWVLLQVAITILGADQN